MRVDDGAALSARIAGSTTGDRLDCIVWRGDATPVRVGVSAWSLSWDVSRQDAQGQASLTIDDPDGSLSPWGYGDLLAPGGSRLSLTWVPGDDTEPVPLGVWRIRRATPDQSWLLVGGGVRRVPGAAQVQVQADEDAMSTPALCRMDAETVRAATRLGEVRRLLVDVGVAMDAADSIDDKPARPAVYDVDRMDAIVDHLDHLDAVFRAGPDGALQVIPRALGDPVWTIDGGDEGARISLTRDLTDDGIYNAVISEGESATGKQLLGRAYLRAGPLAWGGPAGEIPAFHRSPATTQAGVSQDATSMLATRISGAEAVIEVVCLAHPGIQLHDAVTVIAPTSVGDRPVVGRVTAMTLKSFTGAVPAKSMTLSVTVPLEALAAVAAAVARAR